MAATNAAALAAPSTRSAASADGPALRPRLSALLLLCRFGTIAALLLAAASFPQSSFFTIRDVTVRGANAVSSAEVVALTRLRPGDPVGAVPPDELARRVASHPRVRSVAVRITPSGHVHIQITERTAVAALPFRGRYIVIDPDGIAMAERDDPAGLPVIAPQSVPLPWMRLGVAVPSAAIPETIRVLADLPPELRAGGVALQRFPAGDFDMVTADRITIRLGRPYGLRERTAALPQILSTIRSRGIAVEYVDLRFSGSVVLKPAGTGQGAGTQP
ncbi:MAG TPA: cell division protein FtsQ/DivIB [bacterium]|jgi:cell division protein FtsQ